MQRFPLQLGLGLRLLQHRVQLGRLHDIALDLQLARHEQALRVGLAGDELGEVIIGEGQGDYEIAVVSSLRIRGGK